MDLTIIVPIYNTPDEMLRGCLDSIRASTLPVDSYRILVLDDGSDRDYAEVLAPYDVDYHRIVRSGTLRARLAAIDLAQGEYVAFVDSDDQVSVHYHLPMLVKAKETGADVVFNDWAFWTSRARYFCTKDSTISRDIDVEGDCLPMYLEGEGRQHAYFVLWNKLYRRELLARAAQGVREASIQAPQFMSYGEDTLINFFVFEGAKRIVGVHSGYYFYRIHEGQTVVVSDRQRLRGQIDMMATTFAIMTRHVRDRKDAKALLKHVDAWKGLMARAHYAYARRREFGSVLPYLRERYGVERLRPPTTR
ncbi:MAG: glycosyltransferase family 2 protein, partial [Clostridia bacterium]|nr:glycosyltransferase family 2 protein [Clostridia bacterium]